MTLNSSCLFAADKLDLPVRDSLEKLGRRDEAKHRKTRSCPSSPVRAPCLRMELNPKHPVTFGMPEEAPALFNNSPAFTVTASFDGEDPTGGRSQIPRQRPPLERLPTG